MTKPSEQSNLEHLPYSPEFLDLISNEKRLRDLLVEGGYVTTEPWDKEVAWQTWERSRRFIAGAINKDGSILDYGSANGFLLRCLQEWSPHKIKVYGIDTDKVAIKRARKLFPSEESHFITLEEIRDNPQFPRSFDFVFWNVWDNYNFEEEGQEELLKSLLGAINKGGRLILGFYRENKDDSKKVIERIEQLGYEFSSTEENPSGSNEVIAWFDKTG